MAAKIRKIPPVCLFVSLSGMLMGKLKFARDSKSTRLQMPDGEIYEIFRHVTYYRDNNGSNEIIFIVRFKFSKFSHKVNKFLSIIPMLLIAGFPGFKEKIYAVNKENGYWQGMYQWISKDLLDEYKESFVFKLMNRRAAHDTLKYLKTEKSNVRLYIENIRMK